MKRRTFLVKSDSDSLDMLFVCCTDDGKYLEGWHLDVGWKDYPSLRYGTYSKDDPCLVPLAASETA